jgi:uncharacterized protein YprB with RNaseH-like and TPR domain
MKWIGRKDTNKKELMVMNHRDVLALAKILIHIKKKEINNNSKSRRDQDFIKLDFSILNALKIK